MNYLAHLFLADPTPDSLMGNLVADFIKGRDIELLPPGIQAGVRMHRQVDSFTDRHPVVLRSIGRISRKWGWFSGILIDVYYDHILAQNWEQYSTEPLRSWLDRIHQCLCENWEQLPEPSRGRVAGLIASDRLFTYLTLEGIAEALRSVSRRIHERIPRQQIELERALPDLQANHADLTQDFAEFFPQLVRFVGEWKGKTGS